VFSFLGSYEFTVDVILVQAILVLSLYVVFQAGLLSLASVGFMAVGAYTTTILTVEHGFPVAGGIAAGAVAAGLMAAVFGIPVLRLGGIYLALGSLALSQAIVIGIANFGFTNGARGFVGIPLVVTTEQLVIVIVVVGLILQLVHRSYVGRAIRAIRLDERTAEGIGINTVLYKRVAFAASGVLAGLSGALEAHLTGVISPDQYRFELLTVALTYMIVGGAGHWTGPLAVTIVLGMLREQLGFGGTGLENIVFGGLLVAIMILAPTGLSDRILYRDLGRWVRRRRGGQGLPVVATASAGAGASAPADEPTGIR
jgi:branched-chain amino acid transport system permease protein